MSDAEALEIAAIMKDSSERLTRAFSNLASVFAIQLPKVLEPLFPQIDAMIQAYSELPETKPDKHYPAMFDNLRFSRGKGGKLRWRRQ